jgi:putative N6-adenine-specific DNA methylase
VSRVLRRLGGFRARALGELERKAALLPFADWLPRDATLRLRVTCHKSRLYHQRAIAERVLRASGLAGAAAAPEGEEDDGAATQLVVVRIVRDEVTVSLDSSGALLHRRGYRQATGKAPLRETLAAALLLASGYDGTLPLLDPFAGSGTIAIEGALLARRIPPGLARPFACQRWTGWPEAEWAALLAAARARILPRAPAPIVGADRDAGAMRSARSNAERAGAADDIRFETRTVSALEPVAGAGLVVSNPPYGVRVSEGRDLRDLYARLGQVMAERLPGFGLTLLVPAEPLERATGRLFKVLFRTGNGGLPVRAVTAVDVPGGSP